MSDVTNLQAQFEKAAQDVKKISSQPSNDTMLLLYAYYKQATAGDVSGSRPGFLDMVGRAKYDAWAKIKGTAKEKAMQDYIALVEKLK